MTKYNFNSNLDKEYFQRVLEYIANFLYGNNIRMKELYIGLMQKYLLSVTTYQPYVANNHVTGFNPGITYCRADGSSDIHMYGFKTSNTNDPRFKFVVNEFIHECLHASITVLNFAFSEKKTMVINGQVVECIALAGEINYKFPDGRIERVGRMFNELLVDMLTSAISNRFDPYIGNRDISISETLKNPYTRWCDAKSGYTGLVTLAQLVNAAFSLEPVSTLATIVNRGDSILNRKISSKVLEQTGAYYQESLYPNLFIDSILCNPLLMQREFDRFMGDGSYYSFAKAMDAHFEKYLDSRTMDISFKRDILKVMKLISVFLNARKDYYHSKGFITLNDMNETVGEYNNIWNNIQSIYGISITQADINSIYRMTNDQIAVNRKKLHY